MAITIRRHVWVLAAVAVLAFSTGLFAQQAAKSDPKKQNDDQRREAQAAVAAVDAVMAGQAAANDLGAAWLHSDVLKSTSNRQYVPFMVSIDPTKVAAGTVTFYWRATAKGATITPPAPANDKDKKNDKNPPKRPDYPYEDVSFVPVAPGAPITISRPMTLPAGDYDVYVVVKEATSAQKAAAPAKMSVVKASLTVPNLWTSDLATSSVIVGKVDPLNAQLTPQQQIERPYALGGMEITPAVDTKLSKKGELSVFMVIYNEKGDGGKPNVEVEYNFYQKAAGAEKFFNKTAPQAFNAQTLPPQFDLAQGHMVQTGQAVPLASFPEGDYRLEIKVTDKAANKSITRDVNFTVAP